MDTANIPQSTNLEPSSQDLPASQKRRITSAINDFKQDSSILIEKINDYSKELFEGSSDGIKGIKTQINEANADIQEKWKLVNEKSGKIDELYNELFESIEGEESLENAIKNSKEEIEGLLDEVNKKKDEFDKYYIKIFGFTNEDGTQTKGLKQEIEERKTELDNLHNQKQTEFKALFEKIEGLLPGATSAGLAETYAKQKDSYKWPDIIWSMVFVATMVAMAIYAIVYVRPDQTLSDSVYGTISRVISRMPFFIPAIWLGYFASKQQSQNKRLTQEYAYKENLAKSFIGYKNQIEELGQSDENMETMKELLGKLVEMAGYNPSITLENKSHRDEPSMLRGLFGWFGRSESKDSKE